MASAAFVTLITTVPAPVEVTAPVLELIAAVGAVEPLPSAQLIAPVPLPPVEVAV